MQSQNQPEEKKEQEAEQAPTNQATPDTGASPAPTPDAQSPSNEAKEQQDPTANEQGGPGASASPSPKPGGGKDELDENEPSKKMGLGEAVGKLAKDFGKEDKNDPAQQAEKKEQEQVTQKSGEAALNRTGAERPFEMPEVGAEAKKSEAKDEKQSASPAPKPGGGNEEKDKKKDSKEEKKSASPSPKPGVGEKKDDHESMKKAVDAVCGPGTGEGVSAILSAISRKRDGEQKGNEKEGLENDNPMGELGQKAGQAMGKAVGQAMGMDGDEMGKAGQAIGKAIGSAMGNAMGGEGGGGMGEMAGKAMEFGKAGLSVLSSMGGGGEQKDGPSNNPMDIVKKAMTAVCSAMAGMGGGGDGGGAKPAQSAPEMSSGMEQKSSSTPRMGMK